jgi:hypothetical protein
MQGTIHSRLPHGSFYHYFDSKESLFREIAEEVEVRLVSIGDVPPHARRARHARCHARGRPRSCRPIRPRKISEAPPEIVSARDHKNASCHRCTTGAPSSST